VPAFLVGELAQETFLGELGHEATFTGDTVQPRLIGDLAPARFEGEREEGQWRSDLRWTGDATRWVPPKHCRRQAERGGASSSKANR